MSTKLLRRDTLLSTGGLVILALIAVILSIMALTPPSAPSDAGSYDKDLIETATATEEPAPTQEPTEGVSVEPEPEPEPEPVVPTTKVLVIGDSYSVDSDDPAQQTWVNLIAGNESWEVVNLSAPGRGFLTAPRICDNSPCEPFPGTVEAVAAQAPDIVITFGGAADGDVPIGPAAAQYFEALRAALPEATIIALSPIAASETVPDWLPLHVQSVLSGVDAVGGLFVDLGYIGIGDSVTLSAESQSQIAATVQGALDGITQQ